MPDRDAVLAKLRPAERRRLDRFAQAFDRIDASGYAQLADGADRAEDRARLAASVERAVVGLILWDELPDAALGALIGRWAPFVEDEEPD